MPNKIKLIYCVMNSYKLKNNFDVAIHFSFNCGFNNSAKASAVKMIKKYKII